MLLSEYNKTTYGFEMSALSEEKPTEYVFAGIGLENFKVHEKVKALRFRPITLLIGPNSSGKTALFQPLLLLKQSFMSKSQSIEPLALNGDFVNLGSFADIVLAHDKDKTVKIECIIEKADVIDKRLLFKVAISYDKQNEKMFINCLSIENADEKVGLSITSEKIDVFNREGVITRIDLPPNSSLNTMGTFLMAIGLFALMNESGKQPIHVNFVNKELTEKDVEALGRVSTMFMKFTETLNNLNYVGPLREYPQRYYKTTGERFLHVGKRGQRAVEIICNDNLAGAKAVGCELARWLKELGVAQSIRTKKIGEGLYSLILKTPVRGTEVNIADMGFGVSQIVPIIVETCILKNNQTAILEQPEIHLHPLGQMIMADLIIQSANQGRRYIIESHSEHLLLRLQRRIAEGKISSDHVAVYYFKPEENQVSIRELKLAKNGQFEDLPPGFMDERLEEAYNMATASDE